jgi:hypothetical protein
MYSQDLRSGDVLPGTVAIFSEELKDVARLEHLLLLKQDVDSWNLWRQRNPDVKPDLSGADLHRADLAVANLAEADLRDANLVLANMEGANLTGANLSGANLVGARLLGVEFARANVSGADLRTAEDLTREQINETRGNSRTCLPEGLEQPARWRPAPKRRV